jgi:hypothetical protein
MQATLGHRLRAGRREGTPGIERDVVGQFIGGSIFAARRHTVGLCYCTNRVGPPRHSRRARRGRGGRSLRMRWQGLNSVFELSNACMQLCIFGLQCSNLFS